MFALRFTLAGLLCVWGALAAALQDTTRNSTPEQRLSFARKAALEYRFRVGDQRKFEVTLEAEPLLRWINRAIREDDGMLFLWRASRERTGLESRPRTGSHDGQRLALLLPAIGPTRSLGRAGSRSAA
jgi:hypothetical protein